MSRRALILGVSGQDGAYLARSLLNDGYEVHGSSRDRELANRSKLVGEGIADKIVFHTIVLTDFRSVLQGVSAANPDEIYNLAGQSSVGLSFDAPTETFQGIVEGTMNILEKPAFSKIAGPLLQCGFERGLR